MKALPLDIGTLHFVGIGGIGMSGIAEILFQSGYQVQGSDLNKSNNTTRLESLGIKIYIGQKKSNVVNAKKSLNRYFSLRTLSTKL